MMTSDHPDTRKPASSAHPIAPDERIVDVRDLMRDQSFVMIQHGERLYRLRITRNNNLILTRDEAQRQQES